MSISETVSVDNREVKTNSEFFPNNAVARSIHFHVGAVRSDILAQPREHEDDHDISEDPMPSIIGSSIIEKWCTGSRRIVWDRNGEVRLWKVKDDKYGATCTMERIDETESTKAGYKFTAYATIQSFDTNPGLFGECGDFLEQINEHKFHPESTIKEQMIFDTEGTLLERVVAIEDKGTEQFGWFVRQLRKADEVEDIYGFDERV
ncbi:MAG TPA: hypothetical protein VJC10_03130 [Patescibacteria group bacterium]|nr:hypothetical protein [Patescibacteria group bacterium]